MDWVTLSEADLAATISQREIDAFRQDASTDGTDAVQALLDRTAATVRVYLASNTAVRLDPDPLAIPPGLVSPACAIAAYDILKRLPVPVGEDRKDAKTKPWRCSRRSHPASSTWPRRTKPEIPSPAAQNQLRRTLNVFWTSPVCPLPLLNFDSAVLKTRRRTRTHKEGVKPSAHS